MKINPVLTIISLLFAALVGYGLYSFCRTEQIQWLITIMGGVSVFLVWAGTLGVNLKDERRNVSFKVLNALFAVLITALQIIFTFSTVSMPAYILTSGTALFIWFVIAYALGHKK